MTNREYLDMLMREQRLQEWFDAEHQDVTRNAESDGTSNKTGVCETHQADSVPQTDLSDTREKLEADVRSMLFDAFMTAWMWGREDVRGTSFGYLEPKVFELLDRQAAITAREAEEACEVCHHRIDAKESRRRKASAEQKLNSLVNRLMDKGAKAEYHVELCDWTLDFPFGMSSDQYQRERARNLERGSRIGELTRTVEELERERDKYIEVVDSQNEVIEGLKAERDELKEKVANQQKELKHFNEVFTQVKWVEGDDGWKNISGKQLYKLVKRAAAIRDGYLEKSAELRERIAELERENAKLVKQKDVQGSRIEALQNGKGDTECRACFDAMLEERYRIKKQRDDANSKVFELHDKVEELQLECAAQKAKLKNISMLASWPLDRNVEITYEYDKPRDVKNPLAIVDMDGEVVG